MDRQIHDYSSAAAMAFAQQQQFGYHPQQHQHQQFPPGPPFLPPTQHPSLQHYPFRHPVQQQQQQQSQQIQHHPHLLHHHLQPPPAFSPHLPPHLLPSPFASAPPPPVPPPSDPELHKRIEKLVEYAAKNGPEFEAMIREKQQDNPAYSFLFGGEGHSYYSYKLWLSTRPPGPGVAPFNPLFPSSLSMMHPPPNSAMIPSSLNAPPNPPMITPSPLNTPLPFFDHHHQHPQHSQPFIDHGRSYSLDNSGRPFKGLSGPLPSDVALELSNVLISLTGTKESIKGAKMWFMQRSPFAPALAEAIRERFCSLDDSEKQLHMIYFANDILFDSLQRRVNPRELDNEALAFKPVLGSMLARIFHNPQNRDENQSRLQKILQFWASKEVYDHDTIRSFESEMIAALSTDSSFPRPLLMDMPPPAPSGDPSTIPGVLLSHNVSWQSDMLLPATSSLDQDRPPEATALQIPFLPLPNQQQSAPKPDSENSNPVPPYPLFPPGLIPGMVRKMQIGSGVPYSPMSPLDIPTLIPPSTLSPSRLLQRVSKFFDDIGEPNPCEGPVNPNNEDDDDDFEGYGNVGLLDSRKHKGGACIPPPPNLSGTVDPDVGMDRNMDSGGSDPVGVGAAGNEDLNKGSQYDDVYSSYRKQRSTNYHSSMSSRASSSAATAILNLEAM